MELPLVPGRGFHARLAACARCISHEDLTCTKNILVACTLRIHSWTNSPCLHVLLWIFKINTIFNLCISIYVSTSCSQPVQLAKLDRADQSAVTGRWAAGVAASLNSGGQFSLALFVSAVYR
jgi:hypothetical protein